MSLLVELFKPNRLSGLCEIDRGRPGETIGSVLEVESKFVLLDGCYDRENISIYSSY